MNRIRTGPAAGVWCVAPFLLGCSANSTMTAEDRATITAVAIDGNIKASGPAFVSEAGNKTGGLGPINLLYGSSDKGQGKILIDMTKKTGITPDKTAVAEFERTMRAGSGLKFADPGTPANAHFHLTVWYGYVENNSAVRASVTIDAELKRTDGRVLWRRTETGQEGDVPGYPLAQIETSPHIIRSVFPIVAARVADRLAADIVKLK